MNEDQLRSKAKDVYDERCELSTIFSKEAEHRIPKFHPREIEDGAYLGSGGFCTVTELVEVFLNEKSHIVSPDNTPQEQDPVLITIQDRTFISKNIERDGQARYAIKRISKKLIREKESRFIAGVVDLAIEVKFLAVIQHPHIIKMRAMSTVHYCSDAFFIVLDRLYDTLEDRMEKWEKAGRRLSGLGGVRDLKGTKKEEQLAERLVVAYDLCSALAFLHSNKIIYRDIKPENIGFDVRGDVKLFDFGLAVEMLPADKEKGTDMYHLTGDTGSPRYMAPEVALGQPYNQKADVYSFALLIWELYELKTPFSGHTRETIAECVYKGNERPKIIPKKYSDSIRNVITSCWSRRIDERLECEAIGDVLRSEICVAYGEEAGMIESLDISSRTEKSIRAQNSRRS